jgi:hypothetical protein
MAPSSASRSCSVASPTESTQRADGYIPVRAAAGLDTHTQAEGDQGGQVINRSIFWSLAQAARQLLAALTEGCRA